MIRLVKTVATIIGYAAFATTKIDYIKKHGEKIENVIERDQYTFLMGKNWANRVLDSAGVTVSVTGDNSVRDHSVLFVSNHEGNFDIPVLMSSVKQPFGFVSKVEVKQIPFLDRWMQLLNCIYLDRSDRRSSLQMIKDGVQSLKDGHSVLIFPEGHRSKGEGLQEFKAGSLKLAKSARVDIVPIAISGTSKIMEQHGGKKMVPGHVKVHILEPISADIFKSHSLQEVSEIIKEKIAEHIDA